MINLARAIARIQMRPFPWNREKSIVSKYKKIMKCTLLNKVMENDFEYRYSF